jgi:general secretion pathway protein L
MSGLVPARIRRFTTPETDRLIASVDGNRTVLFKCERNGWKQIGVIDLDAQGGPDLPGGLRRRSDQRNLPTTLLIQQNGVVNRNVDLPIAATENLRDVIGFEMERLTPFAGKDVYFDFCVGKRDVVAGKVAVTLSISPRNLIDQQITTLTYAGLAVDRIDVATDAPGTTLGLNLFPPSVPKPRRVLDRVFSAVVILCALAAGISIVAVPLDRQARYSEELHLLMIAAKAKSERSRKLKDEITKLRESGTYLFDLRKKTLLISEVLDTATMLLPDHAWLTHFRFVAERLEIEGFSPNSSELIGIFEASPIISDAKFSAPVTQDPVLNMERFGISMRINQDAGK